MQRFLVAIGLELLLSGIGQAQGRPPEPASPDAGQKSSEAQKGAPGGADTTTESFGDWSIVCVAQSAGAQRICEVDTSLTIRGQTGPVAQISLVRQAKDKPMRLIALAPVNVSIPGGVRIETADKTLYRLPYSSCVPAACIAELELSGEQTAALRAQTQAGKIIIDDPTGAPAALPVSFKGFGEALDAYAKWLDRQK